jgi:hypothetical protein
VAVDQRLHDRRDEPNPHRVKTRHRMIAVPIQSSEAGLIKELPTTPVPDH